MTDSHCDIGVDGLGPMGTNLVLNMVDHGLCVAVYNHTTARMNEFVNSDEARGKPITPCHSLAELVASLKPPRKVMLMIKAGDPVTAGDVRLYPDLSPVDAAIGELCGLLSPGDVILDGGNSHFEVAPV